MDQTGVALEPCQTSATLELEQTGETGAAMELDAQTGAAEEREEAAELEYGYHPRLTSSTGAAEANRLIRPKRMSVIVGMMAGCG